MILQYSPTEINVQGSAVPTCNFTTIIFFLFWFSFSYKNVCITINIYLQRFYYATKSEFTTMLYIVLRIIGRLVHSLTQCLLNCYRYSWFLHSRRINNYYLGFVMLADDIGWLLLLPFLRYIINRIVNNDRLQLIFILVTTMDHTS